LQTGQFTEPIRTRQGYVILKVTKHVQGGIPPFKDVQDQAADAYYMTRMEPAIRDYLTKMRDDGYVVINDRFLKAGYTDTGASAGEMKQSISYSSYTPPSPKKKKKIERTRFRETDRGFRQKTKQPPAETAEAPAAPSKPAPAQIAKAEKAEKPGKKEKIRYGQAPTKTLPKAAPTPTEDAGAVQVAGSGQEPANPLENTAPPEKKTRFSDRSKASKQPKAKGVQPGKEAPESPDAAEVADRQTQSAPLGNADPNAKKKKGGATAADKTRMSDRKKSPDEQQTPQPTPIPTVPGAPAPAPAQQPPATAPQQ